MPRVASLAGRPFHGNSKLQCLSCASDPLALPPPERIWGDRWPWVPSTPACGPNGHHTESRDSPASGGQPLGRASPRRPFSNKTKHSFPTCDLPSAKRKMAGTCFEQRAYSKPAARGSFPQPRWRRVSQGLGAGHGRAELCGGPLTAFRTHRSGSPSWLHQPRSVTSG